MIWLFLSTGGGLHLTSPAPVEALTVERTILKPGQIDVLIRNSGPQDLTVAQVIINNAVWPFKVTPEAHHPPPGTRHHPPGLSLVTRRSLRHPAVHHQFHLPFDVNIPVAFETPAPDGRTFLSFTLIGLYVGVIPVFLGLFWFPALRQLGRRWMTFLLAITAGLLVFLGLDTLSEALEQAAAIPGAFQGIGLVGIGAVGTFLLLDAISKRQAGTGRSEAAQRLSLAYMIAIGIGLHNLGEGLAIGAAYQRGRDLPGRLPGGGFHHPEHHRGVGHHRPGAARPARPPPAGADGPGGRRAGHPGGLDRRFLALADPGGAVPGSRHRRDLRGGL